MSDNLFNTRDESREKSVGIKALTMLQQGNYPEALKLFNEYINMREEYPQQLDEDDAMMYYNRSIAKEEMNDKIGAISDLEKSIGLSDINQAYFRLADLQSQTGRQQEALENLIRAYKLGSKDAEEALRQYTNYFNQ